MTTGRSVGGRLRSRVGVRHWLVVLGIGCGGPRTWASRGGRGWPWWWAVGVGATEDRVALARPQTLSSK